MKTKIIMATSLGGVIGHNGKLPWPRLKGELAHFKRETMGDAVVMGRNTWESIPDAYKPLEGRTNIVLSDRYDAESLGLPEGVHHTTRLWRAQKLAQSLGHDTLWIIGGKRPYDEGFWNHYADEAVITQVHGYYPGDTMIDLPIDGWEQVGEAEHHEGWSVVRMRKVKP